MGHISRRIYATVAIFITLVLYLGRKSSPQTAVNKALWSSDGGLVHHERTWWKEAVIYEVYLPSFKDSDRDGIGDLKGVLSKLDHLKDLGVDVVSVGPFYQSPQVDMGYDISNYEQVEQRYGTLEDVDALIKATHKRGMRIIFDLVINHSSNLHKWFQESRSSKTHPKRDWYVWKPARIDADGKRHPPNNWRSHFTVPAWTWDENTEEYYLHIYTPEMPDFNWENADCRKAIYETAVIFWLDRGIDGFRIDTVNKYSKNQTFPDAFITDPDEESQLASMHYRHGPRIHEYLKEMGTIFNNYGAMSWGELSNFKRNESEVFPFVSSSAQELNMVNNLDIVNFGQDRGNRQVSPPFLVSAFKKELSRWQEFVSETDAWVTIILENHDQGRSISRFASDDSERNLLRSGKLLAMVMATMTGTLILYNGQEIGMVNIPYAWPAEEYKDIRSVNFWEKAQARYAGDGTALASALQDMKIRARDHARTPMQWDARANAGFTTPEVTPWMRVHDDYKDYNVNAERQDKSSLLEFWKKVLRLRKEYKDLFIYGRYTLLDTDEDELFVFMKEGNGTRSLTAVNMSDKEIEWHGIPASFGVNPPLLLGNVKNMQVGILKPWEGRVYLSETVS